LPASFRTSDWRPCRRRFPAPAADWTAQPALSLLEENEIWGDRIAAQRSYVATSGSARIDLTIDVHSPFVPAVSLSFNPLALAGDPSARVVEIGGEKGSCASMPTRAR